MAIELNLINACKMETRDLNRELRSLAYGHRKIFIENPRGIHNIAAGLRGNVEVMIEGSVGYFAGTMIDGPKVSINGNAGWFLGDNMTGGSILVNGHAGNGVGQGIYGGDIAVKEDAGDRVGALMKSGHILIGGDAGIMAGLYMFAFWFVVQRNP